MASAPFSPAITVPADNDIVSQFPLAERTFRDVVTSFIEVDHDATTGGHNKLTMVEQSVTPSFTSSQVGVWAVSDGTLQTISTPTPSEQLGVPAGSVFCTFRTTAPAGYLLCYGQAVSRVTYIRLWNALGSPNTGDGSNTFTMPDLRGKGLFGKDDMGGVAAGVLTSGGSGVDGATLGASGGNQQFTLDATQIPAHTHSSPTDSGHTHLTISKGTSAYAPLDANNYLAEANIGEGDNSYVLGAYIPGTAPSIGKTSSSTSGLAANTGSTGGGLPHSMMPPLLVCNWIMKY